MTARVAIGADMTAGDLHDELSTQGAKLIVPALEKLAQGALTLTPQASDGVTYAAKIDKSETRIDWQKPWREVHNHIRGLSPFPGAWCEFSGQRLRILRTTRGEGSGSHGKVLDDKLTIACGDGAIRIVQLQRAGKGAMTAEEFLRGVKVPPGATMA
jgi:methionyl-tRNA formyltransferase